MRRLSRARKRLFRVCFWQEKEDISPNVLNFLVEDYNIAPISTPDEDLEKLLEKQQ